MVWPESYVGQEEEEAPGRTAVKGPVNWEPVLVLHRQKRPQIVAPVVQTATKPWICLINKPGGLIWGQETNWLNGDELSDGRRRRSAIPDIFSSFQRH